MKLMMFYGGAKFEKKKNKNQKRKEHEGVEVGSRLSSSNIR